MKNNINLSTFFLAFLFFSTNVYSQTKNDKIKRYNIESAFIKYSISGNTKGEEILKFDDFGKREISKTDVVREVVFYSVKNIQKIKLLNVFKNNFLYAIDLNNKTGIKTISKEYINDNKFTKEDILKNGGILIAKNDILGKNCEVWKTRNLKIWLWKGLALKIKSKIVGKKYEKIATEIKENISILPNELMIPNDIKITDYTK